MKLLPGILALALIGSLVFTAILLVDTGRTIRDLAQENAVLAEHNQRLLKSMDRAEEQQTAAETIAENTSGDNADLLETIEEAKMWLWMAEAALTELERVIDEEPTHVPYVLRDVRDGVIQATILLEGV